MKTNINYILVFAAFIFSITLTPSVEAQSNNDKFVVVLDAGHGGKDPGRPTKNGYKESDIALKIALKIGRALEGKSNFEVIYTRKTDVFIELYERANIANRADADLFVSIHCNAHDTQAYGTETFVLGANNTERNFNVAKAENEVIFLEEDYKKSYAGFDPSSPESTIAIGIEQEIYVEQSIVLARKIEDNFSNKAKRKSRGLKQASLLVIRNTYMPSVLIETGFITNRKEGAYLNSKNGQTKISNSIIEAIVDYKKELDENVGDRFFENDIAKETTIQNTSERVVKDVKFKVQIAASSRKLDAKPYNFKGLSDISRKKQNTLYKYFYGETSDYNEAVALKEKAKSKGYSSCFIVAYKNNDRISVEEALKTASN